jgi:sulfur carrier protein ThiS
MSATMILRKKKYEVCHGISVHSALVALQIQPEAVLPTRNGELINEEEIIQEGDVIKLVSVISGG